MCHFAPAAARPSTVGTPALSRSLIPLAVVLFAATRLYLFFGLQPQFSDVQTKYFDYAARVVDLHQIPYQANVEIEYPPLAWWAMYLPRILDPRRITNPRDAGQVVPIYEAYRAVFRGEMFACDLISFALTNRQSVHVERKSDRLALRYSPSLGGDETGRGKVKSRSDIASRIDATIECVSPPALRMDTSLSSPTPPSIVSMAPPCSNERAKSFAASACRSGVPETMAIKHNRNIARHHMAYIFPCGCSFCQGPR